MSDSPSATVTAPAVKATLIVFNKGSQTVTYPGGAFVPGGKPTAVAPEHEEHVRKLLTRYPQILVEGSGDVAAVNKALAEKEAALKSKDQQIAELLEQNKKLAALLAASPDATPAPENETPAPEAAPRKGGKKLI
jgi:hypothetical protein